MKNFYIELVVLTL